VVHRVLQRLLAEGVSIRNLPAVLEVLGDVGAATRDAALLAEHVRPALADTVCRPYLGTDGGLRALLLSPGAEQQLRAGIAEMGSEETITPRDGQSLLDGIVRAIEGSPLFDAKPVLLCAASLRRHVRRITERSLPHLGVLSFAELPPHVNVQTIGTVELSHAPQMV